MLRHFLLLQALFLSLSFSFMPSHTTTVTDTVSPLPSNTHTHTHVRTQTRHLTHSYTHNHTHMHIHTHIHLYPSRNQKMKQKNVSRWRHTFKESTFCGADEKLFFFDSLYHFEMALNSFLLLNLFQRSLGQPVWPNFWIKSLPNFVQIFPKIKRSGFDLNTDNFSKQPKK